MNLKKIIKQKQILDSGAVDAVLSLPGEPMIYSIKYCLKDRRTSVQFLRNMQWKSMLKCFFMSYYRTKIPVVLIVRFYVTPPSYDKVSKSDLKKETVPATRSFEIFEYLLAFIEMLMHVLINSYRQIVKIDAEKYYSNNPRTDFKFMKWDHYVYLQNNDTENTKSKVFLANRAVWTVQPKRKRNEPDPKSRKERARNIRGEDIPTVFRSPSCDSSLPNPSTYSYTPMDEESTTSSATHQKA